MAIQTNAALRFKYPEMPTFRYHPGFTLMEMMISIFLATLLMAGIIQLLGGSVAAYRLQLNQSQMEESGRYAQDVLITHISQAGYRPEPWRHSAEFSALTDESIDGGKSGGDQLGLQRWSDRNCYGNENPVKNSDERPTFYLLQTRFRVNSTNNLALTCRYGPDAANLITQVRNNGLVEGVESMQVLYAEDNNNDNIADHWVTARAWKHENTIQAVKVALLLRTQQPFDEAVSEQITLLDQTFTTPADGRLRRTSSLVTAIHGKL